MLTLFLLSIVPFTIIFFFGANIFAFVFSEEWRSHTKFVFVSGRDPNKIYKPRRFYGSAEDDDFTSQRLAGINLEDAIKVPHDFNDNDLHYVPIGDVFNSNGQVVLR